MKRLLALLFAALPAFAGSQVVRPGAAGPNRLDVNIPLLAGASRDLHDFRLFDSQEREVGYLFVPPENRDAQWLDARLLPIVATKTASGFEADLGRATQVDRLRVEGITAPFLKRATVEGSGDRAHWTLLADATLFDLPDQQLKLDEVTFAPNEVRYLRVTWDDRSSARVTSVGRVTARVHASGGAPEPLREEVGFSKRTSEPGKSRYRIALPGPHLPIEAVEVRVANGNVWREATITEPRLTGAQVVPIELGRARLKRAERWGSVAEELAVPVTSPEGRELELVVDDGNNPPLAISGIVIRLRPQPWIYFESDGTLLHARYGDERLEAPKYDLEASRRFVRSAKVARAEWLGAAKRTVVEDAAPPPKFMGAPIDRKGFRYARAIDDEKPGLCVLLLDFHSLAQSRNLADVRIADERGNQVPYIVERRGAPLDVKIPVGPREVRDGKSVYRIELPYSTLPLNTSLVITTTARVFEREVTLNWADNLPLGAETWRATDPDQLPPPLTFGGRLARVMELVVDEGDNAPLPIVGAKLIVPSYALRFTHPGGKLFLLYGNGALQPPRYDVALLAPRLFGGAAREIGLTPQKLPAEPEEHRERKFFWIGIAVAALLLIALLAKLLAPLAREESQPLG